MDEENVQLVLLNMTLINEFDNLIYEYQSKCKDIFCEDFSIYVHPEQWLIILDNVSCVLNYTEYSIDSFYPEQNCIVKYRGVKILSNSNSDKKCYRCNKNNGKYFTFTFPQKILCEKCYKTQLMINALKESK